MRDKVEQREDVAEENQHYDVEKRDHLEPLRTKKKCRKNIQDVATRICLYK